MLELFYSILGNVMQEDIDAALLRRAKDPHYNATKHCPIGQCLGRLNLRDYTVYEDCVKAGELTFPLPDDAREFIARFDAGEEVEPFTLKVSCTSVP